MAKTDNLTAIAGFAGWSTFQDLLLLSVNYALINGDEEFIKSMDKVVYDYITSLSPDDRKRFIKSWDDMMTDKAKDLAELLTSSKK